LLTGKTRAVGCIQQTTIAHETCCTPRIQRRKCNSARSSSEWEKLRIGGLTIAIRTSTTREQQSLITSRTATIKVQTSLREGANNESTNVSSIVVVQSLGDDVEFLIRSTGARLELDWDQILSEIAGGGVDGQTTAVGGTEGDVGPGTGSCVVPAV
jgi:hypothetical protein